MQNVKIRANLPENQNQPSVWKLQDETCISLCSHLIAELGLIQLALQLVHLPLAELQRLLQLTDLLPLPFQAPEAALHLRSQLPQSVVFGQLGVARRQPGQGGADRSVWTVSEFQWLMVVKNDMSASHGY